MQFASRGSEVGGEMAVGAATHRLLVGVPSYGSPLAFARRQHIRNLSGARLAGPAVQLVFVLPHDANATEEHHGAAADVWRVQLPAPAERRARNGANYGLEKWLLCNAFLRRAVREHPAVDFYVLADDDTLFNATTLHARLRPFAAAPNTYLAFGSVEEWFMWDPTAMVSACFAYSSRR